MLTQMTPKPMSPREALNQLAAIISADQLKMSYMVGVQTQEALQTLSKLIDDTEAK